MRELDVVLEAYLERVYDQLPSERQRLFAALLDEQDPLLHGWMTGRAEPADQQVRDLVCDMLRVYHITLTTESQ
jgi:succinate dehydrogenase flavin-adding protein (antitoxin of CptAB toxin-antitoxin module)